MASSAGSAEKELAIYQESAEYLYNQFKETFTSIAQNAVNRDDLKNLIKFGTSMLELVDGIVSKIGLIPTILSTIVGITASKTFTNGGLFGLEHNFNTGKLGMTFLGGEVGSGWLNDIKQSKENAAAILANEDALRSLLDQKQKGVYIEEEYNKVINNSNSAVRNLANGIVRGKVSQEELNATLQSTESAGKRAGIGANAAALGVKALNIATSMLISMGVSLVIQSICTAFNRAIKSYENNIAKIKELSGTIQSLENDYSDLNSQLSESKKKLRELEKIPNPTLFDEAEIEKIKEANKLLETQIQLKKIEIEQAQRESVEAARKTYKDSQIGADIVGVYKDIWEDEQTGFLDKLVETLIINPGASVAWKNLSNLFQGNTWKQQQDYLSESQKMLDNYIKAKQEYESMEPSAIGYEESERLKNSAKEAQSVLDEHISALKDRYSDWQIELSQLKLDPDNNSERIKELEDAIEAAEKIIYYNKTYGDVLDLYNDAKFANVIAQLEELANKGELTSEKFNELTDSEIEGIGEFKEALESIGFTDTDRLIEAITDRAKDSRDALDDAARSAESFKDALERLNESLDDIIEKQEKLADAFKKVQRGAALSAQEIYELIKEMPSLAQYIERTTDGYTVSSAGINAVSHENQKQVKKDAEEELKTIREQIALLEQKNELEKKRNEFEKEMETSGGSIEAFRRFDNADVAFQKAAEACRGITDSLEDLKSAEQAVIVAQGVLDEVFKGFAAAENYEDAKSEISEYNKKIQTLDKAMRTLDEGASLGYDEMVQLVEIAPDLQAFFEETEDGYTISADKIEWWKRKTKSAREQYIQSLIEQAEAEKKTAEAERDAAKSALDAADAANKAAAAIQYSIAQQNVNNIEDVIKKYKALTSEIKSPDDDNGVSDKLQKEIDYYNNILDAVGVVKDKYTKAIDDEIDALQDSKDALKDANDERQREIDLREAAINLENAKKRKAYVYTEGEGFKQVRDEKAVKEAEEKYRDAVTAVQEAAIDKEIKLREDQKETLEENTKALTELEQNIQDALTIEQAKAALGLDKDSDLLDLPDDVVDDIKTNLSDAVRKKDIEDNNGNEKYKEVTLDSLLAELGTDKKAGDIPSSVFDNVKQSAYNSMVKGFAEALKEDRENRVENISYNNSPVINANFVINGADDPQSIADTVHKEIGDLLREYCNSIK